MFLTQKEMHRKAEEYLHDRSRLLEVIDLSDLDYCMKKICYEYVRELLCDLSASHTYTLHDAYDLFFYNFFLRFADVNKAIVNFIEWAEKETRHTLRTDRRGERCFSENTNEDLKNTNEESKN